MKKPRISSKYGVFPTLVGAQDWIRTSTSLRTLRPEHSASTNFATWASALTGCKYKGKNPYHPNKALHYQ